MRVQEYGGFQAMPTTQPSAQVEAPATPDIAGRQMQEHGQALMHAGDVGGRIAIDMQQEANQLRVIEASNQAKEKMFDLLYHPQDGALSQKGAQAIYRSGDKDLATETADNFKQATDQISDSLGNPRQRQMFLEQAQAMHAQVYGQVEQHLGQEFKSYQGGVMDATVTTAQRDLGTMGLTGNTTNIDEATGRIRIATAQKARLMGLPQALAEETARQQVSAGYTQAIEAALQKGNVAFANEFLTQKKDEMTPHDILRVQGMVTKEVDAKAAMTAVSAATITMSSRFQPSDMDRLTGIVRGMESGGRETNADGTPLTSPKGAQGSMQVMPGTNKDPGFGVVPARDDSPEERARVGRDYLAAMVKQYGNAPQAMAAYNAGPGRLDEAVKKANEAGAPATWIAYLPKETQAYVANGMKKFGSGQGAAPMPTEMDFINNAVAHLGTNPTTEQVVATRAQAEHQYGLLTKAVAQQNEQAVGDVQKQLQENGGDINKIDPVLRSKVPAGKWDDLIKYANVIQRPDHQTNMEAYNRAVTYPEELAAMSDQAFDLFAKTNFSHGDQKAIADIRARTINGKEDTTAESVNTKAMSAALNSRLLAMGVNPTQGSKDLSAKEQIGTMQKFVRDSIFQEQSSTGKKMTPAEIEQHIDGLFAKNINFRRTFMGFDTGRMTQQMMSMKVGDIDSDSLAQIRQKFAANGQPKPSDDQILRLYWTWKNKNG